VNLAHFNGIDALRQFVHDISELGMFLFAGKAYANGPSGVDARIAESILKMVMTKRCGLSLVSR
jgi:hypothetical protein